jgi:hypothetical protein
MHARLHRVHGSVRPAALVLSITLLIGQAHAQPFDCYDRALVMPKAVTEDMAEACQRKIIVENTTNDRHAIALYNAARFYVVLGDQAEDKALKASAYDGAVANILESRDRAADNNVAFLNPWRRGDKRSKSEQMTANRLFIANRSYQLAKAYLELGRLDGSRTCTSRDSCFERAATELESDAAARAAGPFYDDYLYLRATVNLAWGQSIPARRDLEFLKDRPAYSLIATQKLGEMLLAEAQRQLASPLTLSGILAARMSYKAALNLRPAAMAGQIGIAETYLLEARLADETGQRRVRYEEAAREYGLAVTVAASHGGVGERLRAYEGRGEAFLELARLGDQQSLVSAISDFEKAAGLDATLSGATAQLMLAHALEDAERWTDADLAYAEAERRFGADTRAGLARGDKAFARGKRLYAAAELSPAREQFQNALAETSWRAARADAYFFLSAIDLQLGQSAIVNADQAMTAGGGSPYREQACLARIAAGGQAVKAKAALPACAGNDLLIGLFYLRHAQLSTAATIANESRRLAQDAFARAQASKELLRTSPASEALRVSDLAHFGIAVALGCSSAAGLNVPVNLDAVTIEKTKAYFSLHRAYACGSSN